MRVLVNGCNINYVLAGPATGPPVVFIHGFPFSLEMWQGQLDAAASAGYRGIAYDIRGHGMSDVGDGQYTVESHVEDLFGILDQLKVVKPAVVGLSMGGISRSAHSNGNPDDSPPRSSATQRARRIPMRAG
ncbi:MAG TPA: alpha/beta hydrolase [Bacteroidota bacterium]|nr:alpha/beta hydrolase [Bacteroidota bacterium]